MAYSFNGTSQRITATSAVVTTQPFTFAGWGKPANNTVNTGFIAVSNDATNDRLITLGYSGAQAGDPVRAIEINVNVQAAATTTGFSASVYSHALATFSSDSLRTAYINGGSSGSITATQAIAPGLNRTSIAYDGLLTPGSFFPGEVAEVAVWSAVLTSDEIVSLARGFKPNRVRPQSLVFYAPLVRTVQDARGGVTLTNVNSATVADHPRRYG